MKTNTGRYLLGSIVGMVITGLLAASLRTSDAAQADTTAARLLHLEDREQIVEVLNAYGATLDRHDFAAFGQLTLVRRDGRWMFQRRVIGSGAP